MNCLGSTRWLIYKSVSQSIETADREKDWSCCRFCAPTYVASPRAFALPCACARSCLPAEATVAAVGLDKNGD